MLLGSATPSLESWHNATVRRSYVLHTLEEDDIPGVLEIVVPTGMARKVVASAPAKPIRLSTRAVSGPLLNT